jgi:hypothetical protein
MNLRIRSLLKAGRLKRHEDKLVVDTGMAH